MKGKKGRVILLVFLLIFIFVSVGLYIRNVKLKRAEYFGDTFRFDDKVYEEISYTEINPYTETWKVVCKTTDGAWTVYEIKEYPEHEYLVARAAWEGRILKRVK